MRISPLLVDQHALERTVYRGAEIVAGFPSEEAFDPRTSVWLFDWSWRAAFDIAGPDARKWLNGMISANARDLETSHWAPAFHLDPKGRILALLDLLCLAPDRFRLLTDQDQLEFVLDQLRRFVFVSKLEIQDRGEAFASLALRGEGAGAVLAKAEIALPAAEPGAFASRPDERIEALIRTQPGGMETWEIMAPSAHLPALWERLRQAGAQPAGARMQELDRIRSAQPRLGQDIRGAELPQETGQMERIAFNKGCYVGQEIVERIRARGQVHRAWVSLRFPAAVAPGTRLHSNGEDVGEVTSAVALPDQSACGALAYLRRPHQQVGAQVAAGEVTGTVCQSLWSLP